MVEKLQHKSQCCGRSCGETASDLGDIVSRPDTLPHPHAKPSQWHCRFCPVQHICLKRTLSPSLVTSPDAAMAAAMIASPLVAFKVGTGCKQSSKGEAVFLVELVLVLD